MAFKNTFESTASVDTVDMGQAIEDMKATAKARRRVFERRWYDNNFFDDGFHFRYYTRSSNKVVDLSERSTIYTPQRSIPKASRQIRGISNLLMSQDPTPTVYPDPIARKSFPNDEMYQRALELTKRIAQMRGKWLVNEWGKDDGSGETILDKVALMTLLSMKHGVSYMEVWPDEQEEEIKTQVFDAFDIYILGNLTSIYDAPFIVKSIPMLISQIKSNPLFDPDQLENITPDNRKASSEIKEAYMQARYGRDTTSDQSATLILNEAFTKEFVGDSNRDRILAQSDGERILKNHKEGSPIIRQTFEVAGIWLYDHYTNLSEYPFVDYRLESGPIYQVPLIERFMPSNKSLDSVVSRVERYTHTMVTGAWIKRRGEQFKLNNIAGGQVVEYDAVPPTQAQISPIPPFVFQFIELLQSFIEEQGVSTTTLGKLPAGIQANAAIESLKESEYANLIIPTRRLNSMMKRLARKFLEIADEHFVSPHEVSIKEKGEITNFQVIGARAARERKRLKIETPFDVITLSKDTKVDIEIEEGMAYTKEGQKATMQQVMDSMIKLIQVQAIPVQAIQVVAKKYLETYQFGATEEFMDAIDEALKNTPNISDEQMAMVKLALLQVLQDVGEVGAQGDQKNIMRTKIGTLEAMKESGLAKGIQSGVPVAPVKESVSIAYKDAPEDVKRQMEANAGFQPSQQQSPVATQQVLQHAKIITELTKAEQQSLESEQKRRGGNRNEA